MCTDRGHDDTGFSVRKHINDSLRIYIYVAVPSLAGNLYVVRYHAEHSLLLIWHALLQLSLVLFPHKEGNLDNFSLNCSTHY